MNIVETKKQELIELANKSGYDVYFTQTNGSKFSCTSRVYFAKSETGMKKYTVKLTKNDGMKSTYFVLANSAGGAENVTLSEVYNAEYAIAENGWAEGVVLPDLFTQSVARDLVNKSLLN